MGQLCGFPHFIFQIILASNFLSLRQEDSGHQLRGHYLTGISKPRAAHPLVNGAWTILVLLTALLTGNMSFHTGPNSSTTTHMSLLSVKKYIYQLNKTLPKKVVAMI